eukprot:5062858-Alexandrium_andersonii.AAC.1
MPLREGGAQLARARHCWSLAHRGRRLAHCRARSWPHRRAGTARPADPRTRRACQGRRRCPRCAAQQVGRPPHAAEDGSN